MTKTAEKTLKRKSKILDKYLEEKNLLDKLYIKNEYIKRVHRYINLSISDEEDPRYIIYLNIFVYLALYTIMVERGYKTEQALDACRYLSMPDIIKNHKSHRRFDVLPNGFDVFTNKFKDNLYGNPGCGLIKETIYDTDEEFSYKVNQCMYYNVCVKYNCKELIKFFCESNCWSFKDMPRHIEFTRSNNNIGEGGEYCISSFTKKERI